MTPKIAAYIAGAVILLVLVTAKANRAFAALTPAMKFRGSDPFGNGTFGASRDGGTRSHNGVDVVATPGQAILSPISGKVVRIAYPYATDHSYTGLVIENGSYTVKIFYITPTIAIGSKVSAGQKIAVAQNLAAKYPGIINHVHIEVYDSKGKLLNPTNLF